VAQAPGLAEPTLFAVAFWETLAGSSEIFFNKSLSADSPQKMADQAHQAHSAQQPLLGSASQCRDYGSHANSLHGHSQEHETTVVHFSPGDPEDPRNWSRSKKWLMVGPILLIDLCQYHFTGPRLSCFGMFQNAYISDP